MRHHIKSRFRIALPFAVALSLFASLLTSAPSQAAGSMGGGSMGGGGAGPTTFSVTYNGNGNTGGSIPVDSTAYLSGALVSVAGQNGLSKPGYTFGGWSYSGGMGPQVVSSFNIFTNTMLTAVWILNTTFSVTYLDIGKTSGVAPVDPNMYNSGDTVTMLGAGTLVKTGYSFGGWTDCVIVHLYGASFTILTNTTVCPVWTVNPYTVHYLPTGSTSGTAPTDPNSPYASGATVTVMGQNTLLKTGYHFGGWKNLDSGVIVGSTFVILTSTDFDPVWIPNTYTVTYFGTGSDSGTAPVDSSSPYASGASVTLLGPGNLVKFQNTFGGWTDCSTPSVLASPFIILHDVHLCPAWIPKVTYTVTYLGFGSTSGTPPIDILSPYSSGDVVFILGAGSLVKTGYTLTGWDHCPPITSLGTSFVILNDTTLCAIWAVNPKYKVTYNGNGFTGGSVPSPTIGSGLVTLATNSGSLVKTATTFGGWNTKANGLGVPYAVGSTYNLIADVTLYAVWTPAKIIYTITYDGNGNTNGSAPSSTVGAGSVTLATNTGLLIKTGNHLIGWNTSANGSGTTYPLGTSYNLIANITLYALWTPNIYTITYDGNGFTGGSVPSPTVGSGLVTLATNIWALTKSGYGFSDWNTAANGSGTSYAVGSAYTLNADITLYATWIPKTYTVTYDGNGFTGGSLPIDSTAYSLGGTVIVQGPNTLVKSGYTFGGWALGGLMIYAPGDTFPIPGDVTLTAIWTPNIVYTITYDGNGFSGGAVPPPTVGSGPVTLATNSGALVKSGSVFGGWNTAVDGSGTPYGVGSPYTLNANITLYAVWITGAIHYTITYSGNGFSGGSVPSPTIGSGSVTLATNSGALVRTGYTFGGWNTKVDGSGIPYGVGSNYNLTADVTLYAVWIPENIVYTIIYAGNGYSGGSVPPPTIGSGSVSLATNSGALVRTGYTFGGWNTSANGSGTPYAVGSNYTLLADITLYAVWTPVNIVYTITYSGNTNTGGISPHQTVGFGSVTLATNSGALVKSGYIFGGWNTSANGSGTPYAVGSNYTLLADITLYAVWSGGTNVFTITYLGNTNTGGVAPAPTVGSGSVTLASNGGILVKTGSSFGGWNTKADGTGVTYGVSSNYNLIADISLYAIWSPYVVYTITYVGNGNTGGAVPPPTLGSGSVTLATNSGGLVMTGYTFGGWNTKADRSGASYPAGSNYSLTANITLYAAFIPVLVAENPPGLIVSGKIINTSPQKKIALNQIVPVHQQFVAVLPTNAAGYELSENGKLIVRGILNTSTLQQIVGPKDKVSVIAVGKDGLKSPSSLVSLAKDPISLANINFNTDSYKFIGPATKILDQVAAVILQHGYTVLEIWGYVDTQGSKASWITLSNNRAKAVKDYMTKKLKGSGVIIKNAGRAQTQAVGNNNTAAGRALNRRVEIRVS